MIRSGSSSYVLEFGDYRIRVWANGVLATGLIGLRFVTHLDVDAAGIDHTVACVHAFFKNHALGQAAAKASLQASGAAVY